MSSSGPPLPSRRRLVAVVACAAWTGVGCAPTARPLPVPPSFAALPSLPPGASLPWLKGQLHLHTNRSADGHTPPDAVVAWYERHGYDFIVITDHNVITSAPSTPAMLVIPGVEITQNFPACVPAEGSWPCRIHVNGLFLAAEPGSIDSLLPPASNPPDRLGRYIAAVNLVAAFHGIAQINHPNYRYSATLPILRAVLQHGPVLLEVANESPGSQNEGDASHPTTEALWDSLWSSGLTVWGTATDDAHHYADASGRAAEGEEVYVGDRGWVMVHARRDAASIADAIRRGDFYFSNGVTLKSVDTASGRLHITAGGVGPYSFHFFADQGREVASSEGSEAAVSLSLRGITYLRAVVTDHAGHKAWTQPFRTAGFRGHAR